jgi:hypothetical protein
MFQRFGVDGKGRLRSHYRYQGGMLGVWGHIGSYSTKAHRALGLGSPVYTITWKHSRMKMTLDIAGARPTHVS